MNYEQMQAFIETLPKFDPRKAEKGKPIFNLDIIRELLKRVGNPEKKLKCIHIAGTNGKGSVATFLSAILTEAGFKTGTFTSPYLNKMSESILINNQEIEDERLAEISEDILIAAKEIAKEGLGLASEFEILTAIAFLYFSKEKCQIAIIETGLGGSLDSTNVIDNAILNVITDISLDHIGVLGDNLEKIAEVKAGIIRKNSDTIIIDQKKEVIETFKKDCKEKDARLKIISVNSQGDFDKEKCELTFSYPFEGKVSEFSLLSIGDYQIRNAALAIEAAKFIKDSSIFSKNKTEAINFKNIKEALHKVKRKARFEIINKKPLLIVDGAHNEDGIKALATSLDRYFPTRKIVFIVGVLSDKNYKEIFKVIFPKVDKIFTVTANNIRALPAKDLADTFIAAGLEALPCNSLKEAKEKAFEVAGEDRIVCAFGSLYYLGDFIHLFD